MFDYNCLEALDAVVREGGFEKAARVLHLTQSAVSQRIKSLEDRMGRVLLARTAPPEPTGDGMRLLKHFRQVAALEEGTSAELDLEGTRPLAELPVGVNADSLATWFMDVADRFLTECDALLRVVCDDQDATHELLRRGEVLGCVSSRPGPMQGCESRRLGVMPYRFVAAPRFAARHFPRGATADALARAPLLTFNNKDELLNSCLKPLFPGALPRLNLHALPSSEKFADFIHLGHAAGMLPDLQADKSLASGNLVDLLPGQSVDVVLYWHCWSIRSRILEKFSATLHAEASRRLA